MKKLIFILAIVALSCSDDPSPFAGEWTYSGPLDVAMHLSENGKTVHDLVVDYKGMQYSTGEIMFREGSDGVIREIRRTDESYRIRIYDLDPINNSLKGSVMYFVTDTDSVTIDQPVFTKN